MSAAKPCSPIYRIPGHFQDTWAASFAAWTAIRPAAIVIADGVVSPELARIARAAEIALLTRAWDTGATPAADGCLIASDPSAVQHARQTLGADAILGAVCKLSRHEAMEKAEAGADFLVFEAVDASTLEKAAALCAWWDDIATVPCALHAPRGHLTRALLAEARPDFVILEDGGEAGESLIFAKELGLQNAVP
jgi:thiamine-phosphate pyrophosphorylase